MLDRGRRPLPGEPDFDRVKLCHCGSSRNPSQAPLPAGFRETGREGQLFPSGSSAALLVIWGFRDSYDRLGLGTPLMVEVSGAVGTTIADRPPHRSVRAR